MERDILLAGQSLATGWRNLSLLNRNGSARSEFYHRRLLVHSHTRRKILHSRTNKPCDQADLQHEVLIAAHRNKTYLILHPFTEQILWTVHTVEIRTRRRKESFFRSCQGVSSLLSLNPYLAARDDLCASTNRAATRSRSESPDRIDHGTDFRDRQSESMACAMLQTSCMHNYPKF